MLDDELGVGDGFLIDLLAQKYREKSEPAATALADFLAAFAAWNATTGTAARILEAQKQMRVAR